MKFRTVVTPPESDRKLTHQSTIVMLGSCFSDSIATRLRRQLFDVESNPFGTLYNPASIMQAIKRAANSMDFSSEDFLHQGNLYYSFDCHSSISAPSPSLLAEKLNTLLSEFRHRLSEADSIFLTFGTSWVYVKKDTNKIVANCHKLPSSEFDRRRLSLDEATHFITDTIQAIRSLNPTAGIYLTVSPIRHLADGAHENQLSKSTLLLAIDSVMEADPGVRYFPAYEIILDDLRDYRFYSDDMTHPSNQAADYIYEQFATAFFTPSTIEEAKRYEKIARRLAHRPITADSRLISEFNTSTQNIIARLLTDKPHLRRAINKIYQPQ